MNRVINFHSVRDIEWFENVVIFLKNKYEMISAKDIINYYNGENELYNACLITVDDGDVTSYTTIYPVLKKYNVPAIFFVSPLIAKRDVINNFWFQELSNCDIEWCTKYALKTFSYIKERQTSGNDNLFSLINIDDLWKIIKKYKTEFGVKELPPQNMTVEQIKKIDREGLVTIGAHTMWHPFLASESNERCKKEIINSINELSKLLGHPVVFFAYPNGRPKYDFGEREINILKHTSCKISFSTQHKGFTYKDNMYAVPRFGLTTGSLRFVRLKLMLGNYYTPLHSILLKLNLFKLS